MRNVRAKSVAKRFAKSIRLLARAAPNLRECPVSDLQQAQAAVDALLRRRRSGPRSRAAATAVKSFVHDRITRRARTGWRGLLPTLYYRRQKRCRRQVAS
jgi:hypothetical protein